jgi:4-hydroxy-2-oxoheptanedioate aldolase
MRAGETKLRDATSSGTAFGVWCTAPTGVITEQLALIGPDYVCIDCQHGLVDYADMVSMLQGLARTEVTPVVRVLGHDVGIIGKTLDAGAEAVIVPMVEDRDQAARVAAACRYPPVGVRSYGPVRAATTLGTADPAELGERVLCFVMIETARGIANADEICATPGVDGVYIGPVDLAISLGERPGGLVPGAHTGAVEHVLDRCRAHGIIPAIHSYDGATAARYAEMGFRMVTVGVDLRLLRQAAEAELRAARTPSVPNSGDRPPNSGEKRAP